MLDHGVTQEGGVGEAGGLSRNEVIAVLDDDGLLVEVANHVIGRLAGGLAAAEEDDLLQLLVGNLAFLQELGEVHALLEALDLRHLTRGGTGGDDDLVEAALDGAKVVDLGVEADFDAGLFHLTLVPLDEFLVVLFEGHGGSREEQAAELVFSHLIPCC